MTQPASLGLDKNHGQKVQKHGRRFKKSGDFTAPI